MDQEDNKPRRVVRRNRPDDAEPIYPETKRRMIRTEERTQKAASIIGAYNRTGNRQAWPLDGPGMPLPGPDFVRMALAMNDDTFVPDGKKPKKGEEPQQLIIGPILQQLYNRALTEPGFELSITGKPGSVPQNVVFVSGHIWGQYASEFADFIEQYTDSAPPPTDGPHPADVMVIGKMPMREEIQARRNFVGPPGELFLNMLRKVRAKDIEKWYVTNLIKFMPPDGSTSIRKSYLKDCLPLLHMELRVVRPKYILCVGTDASKALFNDDKYGVTYMEGRVLDYSYPVDYVRTEGEPLTYNTAKVMTVYHPGEVLRDQAKERVLERGLARFCLLTEGMNFDKAETDIDHRTITTLEDAQDWIEEANAYLLRVPLKRRLVAVDAEWEGQHPMNKGSYLRTVQVAWKPKHSVCFKISDTEGNVAFTDMDGQPAVKQLAELLTNFFDDKRVCGHFFVSDLEWLHWYGIDPIRNAEIPLDPTPKGKPAWARLRDGEGWLCTGMLAHAIEETASLGLESLANRYTTCPRWDIQLEEWKKQHCKARGIKPGALEGYGPCPDEILHPYANYDTDATLRLCFALLKLLDVDYDGNCCWEPAWESMIAQPVILDIHKNGIRADRKRNDMLTESFMEARAAKEKEIQDWAKWPQFNIRSVQQVKEFLFGEDLNGKFDKENRKVRIRPFGAISLNLTPILDTSKPPKRWAELVERNETAGASPSTGKSVLGILSQKGQPNYEQVGMVRDYRFLDQVLKSVLRPPALDDDDEIIESEDGDWEYDAGLVNSMDDDGMVRTHLYSTAETGRWKSSRPNLQNISKARDPDYVRLLGKEKYKHKLRSILKACPGTALVEFDYTGAELYGMAIMSGDRRMIEHAERSLHPDSGFDAKGNKDPKGKFPHPQYYDIHSNIAVLAFRLTVPPGRLTDADRSKKYGIEYNTPFSEIFGIPAGQPLPATKMALDLVGRLHFRILAKNVIFGVAYGRGAKAIALQAKEQGVNVTVDDAQQVIDTIFATYKGLSPFFAEAKARAIQDRWICHCFGRFRRFPVASDYKMEGEFERQAMNFPIQGMIASAVNRGLARMRKTINDLKLQDSIKIVLQIHDAGLLRVNFDMIPYVVDQLIPYAMRDCVPIYPTRLDGTPTGTGPYYLGLETTVEKHWGEKYSLEECQQFGIPIRFAAA